MSARTPGPWRAAQTNLGHGSVYSDAAHGVQVAFCGANSVFGKDGSHHISSDEVAANARLVAAAPDLLEALLKCVAAIKRTAHYTEADRFAAADFARAAIAKAEGK